MTLDESYDEHEDVRMDVDGLPTVISKSLQAEIGAIEIGFDPANGVTVKRPADI